MTDTLKIYDDCPECGGEKVLHREPFLGPRGWVNNDEDCPTCHGTGKVPVIYTPEKFVAAGHELHDDVAVWVYSDALNQRTLKLEKDWFLWTFSRVKRFQEEYKIIIATPAISRRVLEGLE